MATGQRSSGYRLNRAGGALVLLFAIFGGVSFFGMVASPVVTEGERLGFSPGGSFVGLDEEQVDRDVRRMAEADVRWIRIDVDWSLIEPVEGRFDWSHVDHAIESSRSAGLKVIGLVTYTPSWVRGPGTTSAQPPDDPDRFAGFARRAAERYTQSVDAWEVWNEPNLVTFWASGPDPERYTEMLRATTPVLRRADPGATILVGGLAAVTDAPPGRMDAATFLDDMYRAGARGLFDAVAVHPYTYPTPPSEDTTGAFRELPQLHGIPQHHNDTAKDLWITEYGSPTYTGPRGVTPEQQAVLLEDGVALARSYPWVEVLLVYSLRDSGNSNPENDQQNFGIRTFEDEPKPAWQVLVDLAARPRPQG